MSDLAPSRSQVCPERGTQWVQGGVKTALTRVRDACSVRQRELVEEVLVLQERMDSLTHSLTERTEENATLNTQVTIVGLSEPLPVVP